MTRPRWSIVLAIVFAVALAFRWFFVYRMGHGALGYELNADAQIYWDWASALLDQHGHAHNPFFFGPLYPYCLALFRRLAGDSVVRVLLTQSVLGAASCALLADAAKRLTRPAIGFGVGVVLASFQMAIFMDAQVVMESLLFFFEALLLWIVVAADWKRAGLGRYGALGLIVGTLALGRAVEALLVLVAWVTVAQKRKAAIAGVVALTALPVLWHNHAVTGTWYPYTYNSGYNLYVGNNPEATGSFVRFTVGEDPAPAKDTIEGGVYEDGREYLAHLTGTRPGFRESSRQFADLAMKWIAAHPGRALTLGLRKVAMMWNAHEFPQIESPELYEQAAGPMGLPFLGTFAFLAILACAGWGRLARDGAAGRFVVGYAVVMTLALVPFFVTDRYRIHLVPAVALAAAAGLEQLLSWIRARRFVPLAASLLAGVMLVAIPLPGRSAARVEWDVASELGSRWLRRGDPDRALAELQKAIAVEESGRLAFPDMASVRAARASVYASLGLTLRDLRRHAESEVWFRKAFALVPSKAVGGELALSEALSGDAAGAEETFRTLGISSEQASQDLVSRASELHSQGNDADLEPLLRTSARIEPRGNFAWLALVRLQVEQKRLDEAEKTLEEARAAGGITPAAYGVHRAYVALARGDVAQARKALATVKMDEARRDPGIQSVLDYVEANVNAR